MTEKYVIEFRGYASASVTVHADNEDEALDAAYNQLPDDLCIKCGSNATRFGGDYTMQREWPQIMEAIQMVDSNDETLWKVDSESE